MTGATGYYVEQRKGGGGRERASWHRLRVSEIPEIPGVTVTIRVTNTGFAATIVGLQPNKSFKHRVQAYNTQRLSGYSGEKTTKTRKLLPPIGLTKGTQAEDSVGRRVLTLDWGDAPGTGITYKVRIRDAEKRLRCIATARGGQCVEVSHPWRTLSPTTRTSGILSITFNGSKADVKYPVDGREYEYEVKSVLGQWESGWSSTKKTEKQKAIPHLGHQQDHTVRYDLNSPYPSYVGDAVDDARDAWNDSAVGTSWPNLRICESGSSGCNARNTDGHKVTIKVVSGEKSPGKRNTKKLLRASYPIIGDADCGRTIACVKPNGYSDYDPFVVYGRDDGKSAPWQHMKNLTMVIESPAWFYRGEPLTHQRVYWTDNPNMDDVTDPNTGKLYRYLPAVVMHGVRPHLGVDRPVQLRHHIQRRLPDEKDGLQDRHPVGGHKVREAGLPQRARHRAALTGIEFSNWRLQNACQVANVDRGLGQSHILRGLQF